MSSKNKSVLIKHTRWPTSQRSNPLSSQRAPHRGFSLGYRIVPYPMSATSYLSRMV